MNKLQIFFRVPGYPEVTFAFESSFEGELMEKEIICKVSTISNGHSSATTKWVELFHGKKPLFQIIIS